MKKEKIIRMLKIPLPIIYGETASYDRWRWIIKKIPKQGWIHKVADIGCGRGTVMLELAEKGYDCVGVDINKDDIDEARRRNNAFNNDCEFLEIDLREIDKEKHMNNNFDVVICSEVIEHIVDDNKLLKDISNIMTKDGCLLLMTPYYEDAHLSRTPRLKIEDGGHMREGYNETVLKELCHKNNLNIESIDYATGYLSQKVNSMLLCLAGNNSAALRYKLAKIAVFPLKLIYPILDDFITRLTNTKYDSICIKAVLDDG